MSMWIARKIRFSAPLAFLTILMHAYVGASTVVTEIYLSDYDEKANPLSGYAGQKETIGGSGKYYAIDRLQFGEQHDRECYIKVGKKHIEEPDTNDRKIKELTLCPGSPNHKKYTNNSLYTQYNADDVRFPAYIKGVSVCSSKNSNHRERLKGVKVHRVTIEADGSVKDVNEILEYYKRPNCSGDWHTPAMCKDGWVATEVIVNFKVDGNHDAFTGLNLRCREVLTKGFVKKVDTLHKLDPIRP